MIRLNAKRLKGDKNMAKHLENCVYDKIKILHELSCLLWFIEKHAKKDAQGNAECTAYLERLEKDLEKYVQELKDMVCK